MTEERIQWESDGTILKTRIEAITIEAREGVSGPGWVASIFAGDAADSVDVAMPSFWDVWALAFAIRHVWEAAHRQ